MSMRVNYHICSKNVALMYFMHPKLLKEILSKEKQDSNNVCIKIMKYFEIIKLCVSS